MLSACTNPVLYGLLNENFKAEYRAMMNCITGGTQSRQIEQEQIEQEQELELRERQDQALDNVQREQEQEHDQEEQQLQQPRHHL